jgi:hypothetical protein
LEFANRVEKTDQSPAEERKMTLDWLTKIDQQKFAKNQVDFCYKFPNIQHYIFLTFENNKIQSTLSIVDTPNSGMLSLVEKNLVSINVKSLILLSQ